jgi:phenylacetate-CoA ligase
MPPAAPRDDLGRDDLSRLQAEALSALLAEVLPHHRFYARKFAEAGLSPSSLAFPRDLERLPFTTKAELLASQAALPLYGDALTYPVERYSRLHQTSGTSGRPLRWLDTTESWSFLLDCWLALFRIAGVRRDDRLFFSFSFGPFLGFWAAFEAGTRLGCLCLPAGGMSSGARLRFLLDNAATVVFATPTYALHLAEVAGEEGIDLASSAVHALVVAGEPGGNVPGTRARMEASWGARVIDHSGMTETGPIAIECREAPGGLHILESACWPEVIDPTTTRPVPPGTEGELVLTTFGRWACPLIRYRTGDCVRVDPRPCPCGRALVRLDGGIRGRIDDMIVIRGNNLYPSALQAILHRFPEVAEYRVEVDHTGTLPVLRLEVEPQPAVEVAALVARIDRAIRDELLFRAEVKVVPPGALPRFEMKARRTIRKTAPGTASDLPA